ncbi:major facilitator superfamily domain-containing protein [Lophiotrema nucula]|uniref:Major facilitator superfamily domain-containing protein n=1 Tax=Lophiotrema nucula TaxID=690887 RepID=A0A6A5Z4G3_9PLEO|nr:major facilitator superfamily domain-containing protein [Lophiotrema nucula]
MNPDDEKAPSEIAKLDEAPDGGLRAWLVAAGGFCIFFSTLGFVSAFGVFQEYYMTHQLQNRSSDDIAWVGSVASFLQFAIGAISGPLFDRYGAWMLRPSAILYVFAIMMVSLCKEYWQFMLAQGILIGICMGLLQFPTIAATLQFFDKKRGAAMGIVVCGSSIGGIIFPIALAKMLNSSNLGFAWSVRVLGFIMMPLMLFSCLAIKSRLPPKQTAFFIKAPFLTARYNLLVVSLVLVFLGLLTPLFFLPAYAVSRGVDATLASYFLAITNAASTFGRIIPGVLGDKYGRLNAFAIGSLGSGITIMCMTTAKSTAGLVVYSIGLGFSSGTIISGATVALSLCVNDPRELGTYMGMAMAIGSISALIGPPINGALLDRYSGFLPLSIFSGVFCLAGGAVAFVTKFTTVEGLWGRI